MVLVPQVLELFWNAIEREVHKRGKEKAWQRLLGLSSHLPMALRRVLFRSVHRQLGGSLQFLMWGGAYLDPDLARQWELLGVPVLQGYGTTEAAPIVTTNSLRDRRSDSVGRVLPGQEVKIASDGEVLIRGPNVTQGYWWNPEATAAAFTQGWYRTSDLGYLDGGHLYLHGRKKDMIVLDSGMNVHAQDVENALKTHPDVEDACVLGLPGRGRSVHVHAVLLLKDGGDEAQSIVAQANSRLADHQRVQGVTVWPFPDLPRTHTLKVKKGEVLEYLLNGTPTKGPDGAASTSQKPADTPVLHSIVAEVADVPVETLHPPVTLAEDLGLDSLRRV